MTYLRMLVAQLPQSRAEFSAEVLRRFHAGEEIPRFASRELQDKAVNHSAVLTVEQGA